MPGVLAVAALAGALTLALLVAAAPSPAAAGSLFLRIPPSSVSPLETVTLCGKVSPKLKKPSLPKSATKYETTWVAGTSLGPICLRAEFGGLTSKKLMVTVVERAAVEIASHAFSPKTLTIRPWTTVA